MRVLHEQGSEEGAVPLAGAGGGGGGAEAEEDVSIICLFVCLFLCLLCFILPAGLLTELYQILSG